MAKSRVTWTLTDHICRQCGGRVLQSASGQGATAGGNPIYRCSDCGSASSAMGPDCVCWCGFQHRRADHPVYPYQCRRLSDAKGDTALRVAFLSCGFDPEKPRAEVGIYCPDYYRMVQEKERNQQ